MKRRASGAILQLIDTPANLVRLQRGLALAIGDLRGHDLLGVDHLVVAHSSEKR